MRSVVSLLGSYGVILWSTDKYEQGTANFKKVIDGDKSTITLVTDEMLW